MSTPHLPSPWPRWRLAPLAVVLCAGGCVIPVAPQWDDAEVNYPPYVVTSLPSEGDIFTPGAVNSCPTSSGAACDQREISVTLSDENTGDHLFIRWLVDYPSTDTNSMRFVGETEQPPNANGGAIRSIVRIQPDCKFLNLTSGNHRWVMSVSDRKFLDALHGDSVNAEAPLDSVPDDANRIRAVWLLNCP